MNPQNALTIARVRRMLVDGSARQHREQARITQTEVAAALGVTPATVSRWESGERTPTTRLALAYAGLLELLEHDEAVPA